MTGTVCTLFELQNGDETKKQGKFLHIFYCVNFFNSNTLELNQISNVRPELTKNVCPELEFFFVLLSLK